MRGRNLLDQLLTLAKAQTALERPEMAVSVQHVFRHILEELMPLAEAKHIDIGIDGIEDVLVRCDQSDLVAIVRNLVDNAIRYTPEGGRVDLAIANEGRSAVLRIRDSGPGIHIGERERVFGPFYRTLGTDQVGSGLGLSIVKAITQRMGAAVELGFSEQAQHSGLCVCVRFPVAKNLQESWMENSKAGQKAFWLSVPLVYFFVALGLFGIVAEDIVEKENLSFDLPIQLFLHGHATPTLDSIMLAFTHVGSAFGLVPLNFLIFVLLMRWKCKLDAGFVAIAVSGAALLNFAAKHGFARARPDLWISLSPEITYSFPSGHAMNSVAIAGALIVLTWHTRWRASATVMTISFALIIGISRVYLGVHYPSDISAGWAASIAWIAVLVMVRLRYSRSSS